MTTIAVYQHDGDVEFGWDSAVTMGNETGTMVDPKVFCRGNVVYAIGGVLLAINLIRTRVDWPVYDGEEPLAWTMNVLRPALINLMAEEPKLTTDDDDPHFQLLVSVGGVAFDFDPSFNPLRTVEGVYALGSGGDYAKGALTAGADMGEALLAACSLDPYSACPVFVGYASKMIGKAS